MNGWTFINPSCFDVNRRGTGSWHVLTHQRLGEQPLFGSGWFAMCTVPELPSAMASVCENTPSKDLNHSKQTSWCGDESSYLWYKFSGEGAWRNPSYFGVHTGKNGFWRLLMLEISAESLVFLNWNLARYKPKWLRLNFIQYAAAVGMPSSWSEVPKSLDMSCLWIYDP